MKTINRINWILERDFYASTVKDLFPEIKIFSKVERVSLRLIIRLKIDQIIKSCDFTKVKNYQYGKCRKNNKFGVLIIFRKKWIWSWLNSINTNNTCLQILIDFINQRTGISFDLSDCTLEELKIFFNKVEELKDELFVDNTEIKEKLYLTANMVWNVGNEGVLRVIYNLPSFFEPNAKLEINTKGIFQRGGVDDMEKHIDLKF